MRANPRTTSDSSATAASRRIFRRGLVVAALLAVLAILAGPPAGAQSPRRVLVEEASNASCAPCAFTDPIFDAYARAPRNRGTVIPLVIHANGPGPDTMNAVNPAMHNARIDYYALRSIPKAMVNGVLVGSPGDTAAIARAVDPLRGQLSPITLTVTQRRDGDATEVSVKVATVEPLDGERLRIVVVEASHFYRAPTAGTNGVENFHAISREMLPSAAGTPLELAAGESTTITERFTAPAYWNEREIYVIAYVQDDTTKEVLQAESNRVDLELNAPAGTAARAFAAGESGSWRAIARTSPERLDSYLIEIERSLPEGWTAEVRHGSTVLESGEIVETTGETADSFDVKITPSATHGTGRVTIVLRGERGAVAEKTFRLYAGDFDGLALIHDREGADPLTGLYEAALPDAPLRFAIVNRDDDDLFALEEHELVILDAGPEPLDSATIRRLRNYLAGGGRLFLLGSEIAWGLGDAANRSGERPFDTVFLHNYLHVSYTATSSSTTAVNGIASDPIGRGLGFLLPIPGAGGGDRVRPRKWAATVFHYGSARDSVAGIRWSDGSYRLVYLAFGLGSVPSDTQRRQIVERGITWLMGTDLTDVDESPPPIAAAPLRVAPNPATDRATITLPLERPSHVRAAVYDVTGRLVATLADGEHEAGEMILGLDVAGLPAGVYTLSVMVDGRRTERAFVVR